MTRWKALPHALTPHTRQLVVRLRELKDHSGLSGTALATRTGYSRSSWDRYLNGRTLPPAEAVEALARVCGTEPAQLLALRDIALNASEPPGAPGPTRGSEPGAAQGEGEPARPEPTVDEETALGRGRADHGGHGGGGGHGGHGTDAATELAPEAPQSTSVRRDAAPRPPSAPVPWLAIVTSSVVTAAVMLAGLMLIAPWDKAETESTGQRSPGDQPTNKPYTGPVHPRLGEFVYEPGKEYECAVRRDKDDDLLYAGYSRTDKEHLEKDASRWAVVEAQCLVTFHGITPGAADGSFGNNTERAIKRLQQRAKIAVDGKVGPDTWKVLRK